MNRWGYAFLALVLAGCGDRGPEDGEADGAGPLEEVDRILDEVGSGLASGPGDSGKPGEAVTVKPVAPVAQAVPGEPGFVISPFNGRKIDVRGVPAGTLVADPHFPAAEKKYFVVPEPGGPEKPEPAGGEPESESRSDDESAEESPESGT